MHPQNQKLVDIVQELRRLLTDANDRVKQTNRRLQFASFTVTVMGIYLTVISILIPILGYFFVVEPLRDFENEMDKKVTLYIENSQEKRINQSLNDVISTNALMRLRAYKALELDAMNFNESQLRQLTGILRNNEVEVDARQSLSFILSYHDSPIVTKYFEQVIISSDSIDIDSDWVAMNYLVNQNGLKAFKLYEYASSARSKERFIRLLFSNVNDSAHHALINDAKFVDKCVTGIALPRDKAFIDEFKLRYFAADQKFFQESYFAKKLRVD